MNAGDVYNGNWRGSIENVGGKMKAIGTLEDSTGLWLNPNDGATNESGFTALPGGERFPITGDYIFMGEWGYFWSSTENNINGEVYNRELRSIQTGIGRFTNAKYHGMSVRCLKD